MSLFGTLQISNNALLAAQIGLHVTGNNIANASTPGYVREQVLLTPGPTQRVGGLLLGLGVQVEGIIQRKDQYLEERLRNALADLTGSETQEEVYLQLESLVNELGDTDLSTSLTSFFGSLNDILNQPESVSVRNLAVLQGQTLTDNIRRLDERVSQVRADVNSRIQGVADDINRLLEDIARLNVQILEAEGGDVSGSDAGGLRNQRALKLSELSKITDVRVAEQPLGDVTVFSGGEYIVFQGQFREVTATFSDDDGVSLTEIRIRETDSPLATTSGELAGLLAARDDILGGFLNQLNDLTRALTYEFNKIYSGGQGLVGFSSLSSEFHVTRATAALDQAGLEFTPVNGSFQVQVTNAQTGLTTTRQILVDLNGLDEDTSLEDLAAQLDAVDGLSATITPDRGLTLEAESSLVTFSFANDTSGVLAALGLNTFFSGSSAGDIDINAVVRGNPARFAASQGGVNEDTRNAELLASLLSRPLDSQGGDSLAVLYDRLVSETTQGAALAKSVTEGFRTFHQTLEGQALSISGVSIDEEAVKMIGYQRLFQASARFIATINSLLDTLVNL